MSPFAGDSISEVIAAVLTKDVEWGALPPEVPTAIAVTAVALAGVGAWVWPRRSDALPIRAATIPDAGFLDFSTVAISPDGSQIAYYRDRPVGGGDLYARKLDDFAERVLVNQVITLHPFFSPDGSEVGYTSNEQRAIFKIPLTGGAPIEVARVAEEYPALWLDDGSIIVSTAHVDGKIERGLSQGVERRFR